MRVTKKVVSQLIHHIEYEYDVSSIKLNNVPIWPHLRVVWESFLHRKNKLTQSRSKWKAFLSIRYFWYGISKVYRSYEYLFFSDVLLRRYINGKYVDKSFDTIADHLGQDRCLFIEQLSVIRKAHYPKAQVYSKHICSYTFFLALSLFLFWRRPKIQGNSLFKKLIKKYNFNLNHTLIMIKFGAQYCIMCLFLKWKHPKVIFVQCYHGWSAVIAAAKRQGITVVEVQHGFIRRDSIEWFSRVFLEKKLLPDYLLTFGNREKEIFKTTSLHTVVLPENSIPIGNYLIDFYHTTFKSQNKISDKLSPYSVIVSVSGEESSIEKKVLLFLTKVVAIDPTIGIIYCPRIWEENGIKKTFNHLPKQIMVFPELSIYEAILYSDYHSTVYSTTSIEALALGRPNILINHNGLAEKYFSDLVDNGQSTCIVNTPEEWVNAVKHTTFLEPEAIIKKSSYYIVRGFQENTKKALQQIGIL
jgi:hypothetical protein